MIDTATATSAAVAEALAESGFQNPTVADPVERARAEYAQPPAEGQGETTTTPDPKPAETPAPVAEAKPDDKPAEIPPADDRPANEDEAFNLTAEDFAEMEKNPLAKKAYKSMLRGFRAKTADLAGKRKAFEAEAALVEKIKGDPRSALQALAGLAGVSISIHDGTATAAVTEKLGADPVADALTAASADLDKALTPEGAAVLKPILEKFARAISEQVAAPLKQRLDVQDRQSAEATLKSTVKTFGAARIEAGDEWSPEVEREMAGLVGKVLPGRGTTVEQYVETLYDNVMAKRMRTAARTAEFKRLQAARGASEPTTTARPPASSTPREITAGMSREDATRLAVQLALQDSRA